MLVWAEPIFSVLWLIEPHTIASVLHRIPRFWCKKDLLNPVVSAYLCDIGGARGVILRKHISSTHNWNPETSQQRASLRHSKFIPESNTTTHTVTRGLLFRKQVVPDIIAHDVLLTDGDVCPEFSEIVDQGIMLEAFCFRYSIRS